MIERTKRITDWTGARFFATRGRRAMSEDVGQKLRQPADVMQVYPTLTPVYPPSTPTRNETKSTVPTSTHLRWHASFLPSISHIFRRSIAPPAPLRSARSSRRPAPLSRELAGCFAALKQRAALLRYQLLAAMEVRARRSSDGRRSSANLAIRAESGLSLTSRIRPRASAGQRPLLAAPPLTRPPAGSLGACVVQEILDVCSIASKASPLTRRRSTQTPRSRFA